LFPGEKVEVIFIFSLLLDLVTHQSKLYYSKSVAVEVPQADKWRIKYLGILLAQRQEWHYMGQEEQEREVQNLIDSLCVN
jgi:hypothetical protein